MSDSSDRCLSAMITGKLSEPPMVSAKAANIVFREKERYRVALERIVALTDDGTALAIAREALRGEKP